MMRPLPNSAQERTALRAAAQRYVKVPEGYIGFVEELPGANTQEATLEEARGNLKEAVELVLEANRALAEESLDGQEVIKEPLPTA
jgi:predicted RNase H-like HicB family nuclease